VCDCVIVCDFVIVIVIECDCVIMCVSVCVPVCVPMCMTLHNLSCNHHISCH